VTHKKLILLIATSMLFSGCDTASTPPSIPTTEFITATLPATSIPFATQTALPPTTAPAIAPIAGTTTTEVNVRVDTSTASTSLGTLPAFSPVQIIGKDGSGIWYRIIYIGTDSGWVRADYVQVTDVTAEIPVLGAESVIGSGARGVVVNGVNVRNGAGRDFMSLGLLNQNDVVSILGKDSSGNWVKIEYPTSPDGVGWVAVEFLQVDNLEAVQVIEPTNQPVATVPTEVGAIPMTAVVSVIAAPNEGDSAEVPLAIFTLSTLSARSAQFTGKVSTSSGDIEDWIAFSSQYPDVIIQITCDPGSIQLELQRSDVEPLTNGLNCGIGQQVRVIADEVYLLRISPLSPVQNIQPGYTVKIKLNEP
jgi:uncharacterized protein YgiM (DUF1202 family)